MRMAGSMGGGSDGIYSCVSGWTDPGSCTCDCLGIMCVKVTGKGLKRLTLSAERGRIEPVRFRQSVLLQGGILRIQRSRPIALL